MDAVPNLSDIPIVDFGPFLDPASVPADRQKVAAALHAACRDVGFFYLKNHGVPADLMQNMLSQARTFFETATPLDKQRIRLRTTSEGGDNARGWLRVQNADKGTHEAVDFYREVGTDLPSEEPHAAPYATGMGPNQWPDRPANFQRVADAYIRQLEPLGVSVIRAMALGIGVDESIFVERIDQAFWNLRILGYEGRQEKKAMPAGIGEHTDFGLLTFLLTDATKESLQVLNKDGQWVWADPIENCYLCNIGDMLSTWTNGLYKSTLHRVIHTSDSLRISVPFFFDPNWDAFIAPVMAPPNEEEAIAGIRYSDKFKRSVEKPLWRDPLVKTS